MKMIREKEIFMYQEERLKKILDWLQEEQVLSNQELMKRLQISRDTARRDIIKLTEEGKAIRTHGGIATADFRLQAANYKTRKTDNKEGKRRIGKKATQFLSENGIYFFDASTHMPYVCSNLKKMKVYTHSLDNLNLLAASPNVEVYALGGNLNKENRFFYGLGILEKIRDIRFDAALLGAAAVKEDGIYFVDEEDAYIKKIAAQNAEKVIVLADYPKFQRQAPFKAIELEEIDYMIVDREPDSYWKEILQEKQVIWVMG